ncbi:hypothetical protein [Tenacibaculum sp. 47A_GOM-205m]|uniref:hypothetical protein n=1 Tax=Tenacibaculum sp. 47A_GOM-205m TaxID=1380384 RepID=UPI00048F6F56|nr:hypothetical protein [Tenacibaculum sp. 47A_GOM-205m]
MNKLDVFELPYDEMIDLIVELFKKEYGERKFLKILSKIQSSNKVSKLIEEASKQNVVPNQKDYLYCINTIPFFIFSSGQTQSLGAILALELWREKVNVHSQIANEFTLKNIVYGIVEESESTFI